MKRTAFPILLCILVINTLSAQSRYRYDDEGPEHRLSFGFAPLSLVLPSGKVNVRSEWMYSDNKSLSLLVSIPRPTKIPNLIQENIETEEGSRTIKNRFTQVGAILENRFYFSHTAPQGLYLAPYLRYNRLSLSQATITNEQYETKIKGAIGGFGLGAAFGAQFYLGNHITMDLSLVGVDLKWLRGSLSYSSNDPENDLVAFRNEIQDKLEEIPFIGKQLSAQIDGDQIKVSYPLGPIPAYRFNLSVNYAF